MSNKSTPPLNTVVISWRTNGCLSKCLCFRRQCKYVFFYLNQSRKSHFTNIMRIINSIQLFGTGLYKQRNKTVLWASIDPYHFKNDCLVKIIMCLYDRFRAPACVDTVCYKRVDSSTESLLLSKDAVPHWIRSCCEPQNRWSLPSILPISLVDLWLTRESLISDRRTLLVNVL